MEHATQNDGDIKVSATGAALVCDRYESCMMAALRAIAMDDATALDQILSTGMIDVNKPFFMPTIQRLADTRVYVSRAVPTYGEDRFSPPYRYTTLLEQTAAALALHSVNTLIAADAQPWPYPDTLLTAAIGSRPADIVRITFVPACWSEDNPGSVVDRRANCRQS